jgi:hypothetical protein
MKIWLRALSKLVLVGIVIPSVPQACATQEQSILSRRRQISYEELAIYLIQITNAYARKPGVIPTFWVKLGNSAPTTQRMADVDPGPNVNSLIKEGIDLSGVYSVCFDKGNSLEASSQWEAGSRKTATLKYLFGRRLRAPCFCLSESIPFILHVHSQLSAVLDHFPS